MEASKKDSMSPPYVAAKTLFSFIERLKQGLPTHVDRSLMNGYSGGVMSQLTLAMRYLGLIGNNGETTDLLRDLVHADSEARSAVIKQMLVNAYPFLRDGFSLATATTGTLNQQFRDLGVEGDTLRKCSTFLVAVAKDAGMEVSPHIKTGAAAAGAPRSSARKPAKKNPKAPGNEGNGVEERVTPPAQQPTASSAPAWAKLLIDKMPEFDPTWPADVQSKWFDAYSRLMDMQPK